jgi:hypothetical protein
VVRLILQDHHTGVVFARYLWLYCQPADGPTPAAPSMRVSPAISAARRPDGRAPTHQRSGSRRSRRVASVDPTAARLQVDAWQHAGLKLQL